MATTFPTTGTDPDASAAITAEQVRATAAEAAEQTARLAGDAADQADIAAEVLARGQDVDDEMTRAEAAEAAELSSRSAADSAEQAARLAQDAILATADTNEATARANADTSLQNSISAETSARQASVTSEAARASATESALSGRADNLEAGQGPIKRRVTTLNAADLVGGLYHPDTDIPVHIITLNANLVLGDALVTPSVGTQVTFILIQDATAERTLTFSGTQWNGIKPRISRTGWAPTVIPVIWEGAGGWGNMTGAGAGEEYIIGTAGKPYAYQSGWSTDASVGNGQARFWVDAQNIVHFSGAVKRTNVAPQKAFALPFGYYPMLHPVYVPVMQSGGTAGGFMAIGTNGDVTFTPTGVATEFYLDGVTFAP
jgi:hypothetical protein